MDQFASRLPPLVSSAALGFGKRWGDYNTCIHEFQEQMQERKTKVALWRTLSLISPKILQFEGFRFAILTRACFCKQNKV
jgi:hypothetical protein